MWIQIQEPAVPPENLTEMIIVRGFHALQTVLTHPVITIGNFDGVHRGHQAIIELAVKKARARKGQCVAYTFKPHPQIALKPGAQVALLSTYDEKLDALSKLGVDVVIEEPFSREFSTTAPEQFFKDVLLRRLNAEAVVVGYDFGFGKERGGQIAVLEALCTQDGVELTVVQPQRVDGEIVSSSRIRQHLLTGNLEIANRLLGRQFSYRGIVVKGEGRGRKIGFPTANLKLDNKLALPYGVYATWAILGDRKFLSVTNLGVRPTFQTDQELPALVETHLLDQTIDLYGSSLEVLFVERLRDEKKFSGIDDLKIQIQKDVEKARTLLTSTA